MDAGPGKGPGQALGRHDSQVEFQNKKCLQYPKTELKQIGAFDSH
jgi:hypothetical protein